MATRRVAGQSSRQPTRFLGSAAPPKREEDGSICLETTRAGPYLLAYGGPAKGREFSLTSDEMSIGRDPKADVSIDDPSASRRHALILRRKGHFFLRDLGSANGTYLDGVLHNAERPLPKGARFRVGSTDFVLRDDSEPEHG